MPRRPALAAMSVEDLLKLRDEVAATLSRRASALQAELAALEAYDRSGGRPSSDTRTSSPSGPRTSRLLGRRIPVKYRDKSGNTWSGRGAQPRWMTAAIKAGAKREDFLIDKSGRPAKRAALAKGPGAGKRAKSLRRAKSAKRAKSARRPKHAKRPISARRSKSAGRANSAKGSKHSQKRLAPRKTLGTKSRPSSPTPRPMSEGARQSGAGSQTGDAGRAEQV